MNVSHAERTRRNLPDTNRGTTSDVKQIQQPKSVMPRNQLPLFTGHGHDTGEFLLRKLVSIWAGKDCGLLRQPTGEIRLPPSGILRTSTWCECNYANRESKS